MNISYNMFNGFVSRNLAKLDTLNMTMINEQGVATTLKVSIDKNSAFAGGHITFNGHFGTFK